jgi:ABC-type nickel/cobalt efflux system permease component RcnA/ABC-type uncharacterized transport system substrate-binding protein
VDVATEILFDAQGRLAAIKQHWRFDEAFTAYALQGLDTNGDRRYSTEELKPLAQVNVDSLKEYDYFTYVSAGDYKAGFAAPKDYWLELDDDRLTLHFTLPLAAPLLTKSEVAVQVYDPEYYIDFTFPSAEAARLVGAPAGCRLEVYPAAGPDPAAAAELATVGADQRALPAEMQDLTGGIDNTALVNCGGPTIAAGGAAASAHSAREATRLMAEGAPAAGVDLKALPAAVKPGAARLPAVGAANSAPPTAAARPAPDASGKPKAAAPTPAPSLYGAFMARVMELQSVFNKEVTGALKALKANGWAFWWLGGISFVYGIVHAAGPGHGKVVISSYLLANEQRLRRGVAIAFLSALVQALVAVGLIGVMAIVLNMTSMAITTTAKLFESGSYAIIGGLGIYLLARKGGEVWAVLRGSPRAHRHHHHHHPLAASPHPSPPPQGGREEAFPAPSWGGGRAGAAGPKPAAGCSHHHHASPEMLDQPGLSGAVATVLSVGIRPCSGALIVLVFALAQGVFWAGVASTFVMALGTAMTVAALAAFAVGAKDLARRLVRGNGEAPAQIMLVLELGAAFFITAVGAVLFVGSLSA